jgi:hypothetical protein
MVMSFVSLCRGLLIALLTIKGIPNIYTEPSPPLTEFPFGLSTYGEADSRNDNYNYLTTP